MKTIHILFPVVHPHQVDRTCALDTRDARAAFDHPYHNPTTRHLTILPSQGTSVGYARAANCMAAIVKVDTYVISSIGPRKGFLCSNL